MPHYRVSIFGEIVNEMRMTMTNYADSIIAFVHSNSFYLIQCATNISRKTRWNQLPVRQSATLINYLLFIPTFRLSFHCHLRPVEEHQQRDEMNPLLVLHTDYRNSDLFMSHDDGKND